MTDPLIPEAASPLCGRIPHPIACAICEVLEHEQERAWAKDHCGALSPGPLHLICDRESGHDGNHRGYNAQIDEPMFWQVTVPLECRCPQCGSPKRERIVGLWLCQCCGHEWEA